MGVCQTRPWTPTYLAPSLELVQLICPLDDQDCNFLVSLRQVHVPCDGFGPPFLHLSSLCLVIGVCRARLAVHHRLAALRCCAILARIIVVNRLYPYVGMDDFVWVWIHDGVGNHLGRHCIDDLGRCARRKSHWLGRPRECEARRSRRQAIMSGIVRSSLQPPYWVGHATRLKECGDGTWTLVPPITALADFIASVWGPKLSLHHPNINTTLLGLFGHAFTVYGHEPSDVMSSSRLCPQSGLLCRVAPSACKHC
jgi:hypothetical protein